MQSLVKIIFEKIISIEEAIKQQDDMKKRLQSCNRLNSDGPGKRLNLKTREKLEKLRSDAKNVYVVRENIINEMSNKDCLKWVEKPELFRNLIQYLSENINAYANIADRKI